MPSSRKIESSNASLSAGLLQKQEFRKEAGRVGHSEQPLCDSTFGHLKSVEFAGRLNCEREKERESDEFDIHEKLEKKFEN